MSLADVNAYLHGPFKDINGWCGPHLWCSLQPIVELIQKRGDAGPVAEIGVFHGKFFLGLVKTMGAPENNYAIDVFDMQEFNLDGAGKGNLDTLKQNMANSGVSPSAVEFLRTDSMWLSQPDIDRIRAQTGGFSLFSVDGCHLAEHTLVDVRNAISLTRPDGIVFVDDYYNPSWPGVQEAISKMYLNGAPNFIPLLFTANKLFLCNISFHDKYLKAVAHFINRHYPNFRMKKVKRFGHDTLTVLPQIASEEYIVLEDETVETPAMAPQST